MMSDDQIWEILGRTGSIQGAFFGQTQASRHGKTKCLNAQIWRVDPPEVEVSELTYCDECKEHGQVSRTRREQWNSRLPDGTIQVRCVYRCMTKRSKYCKRKNCIPKVFVVNEDGSETPLYEEEAEKSETESLPELRICENPEN